MPQNLKGSPGRKPYVAPLETPAGKQNADRGRAVSSGKQECLDGKMGVEEFINLLCRRLRLHDIGNSSGNSRRQTDPHKCYN